MMMAAASFHFNRSVKSFPTTYTKAFLIYIIDGARPSQSSHPISQRCVRTGVRTIASGPSFLGDHRNNPGYIS